MSAEDDLKEALELALLHRDSLNYFTNGHPTAIGAISAALADRGWVIMTKDAYVNLLELSGIVSVGPVDRLDQHLGR